MTTPEGENSEETRNGEDLAETINEESLTNADRELLEAMGNCYDVCGEDFENTVRMVSRGRDFTPQEAKDRLKRLQDEVGHTAEYQQLRSRLPEDFPL